MKWKTLQHNGILFPPDFESKEIEIKIKGINKISSDIIAKKILISIIKTN